MNSHREHREHREINVPYCSPRSLCSLANYNARCPLFTRHSHRYLGGRVLLRVKSALIPICPAYQDLDRGDESVPRAVASVALISCWRRLRSLPLAVLIRSSPCEIQILARRTYSHCCVLSNGRIHWRHFKMRLCARSNSSDRA